MQTLSKMLRFSPKELLDNFESTFPATIEAYMYNTRSICTAIKVAGDKIQIFEAEFQAQTASKFHYSINHKCETKVVKMQYRGCSMRGGRIGDNRPPVNRNYTANHQ